MSRFAFIATAGLLALTPAAFGESLPRYDVETECKKIASFGGTFSNMTYVGCLDLEQSSYDGLKRRWPSVPHEMKAECRTIAEFGGGSYLTLSGCLDMEEAAARDASSKSFQY
ncbi:hypothetical protein PZ895_14005 [Mesorhizobium sp. YIM 152430]|uniref:hypothetical protein n=1 Tax=Mesorhizobium sp. YIM 152430 TaxID=3031761 RepID=UPI0023DBAA0E|nr:hypothetical protein [Mesorhizobium sp. YIM 152430]MDF1600878.1 hypothetical protein [Mesorhizobium sp. YIM 152430]